MRISELSLEQVKMLGKKYKEECKDEEMHCPCCHQDGSISTHDHCYIPEEDSKEINREEQR